MKICKSKWLKRTSLGVLGLVLAVIVYGLLQLIEPVAIAPITQATPVQFNGRALVVASDADMVATAYADAQLDRVPGIEDTLTVFGLPLNFDRPQVSEIRVSNSVMSWPHILAVSPDRTKVYVVEVRSRPADGIQEFENIDQMPEGKHLSVVNITNLAQPKLIQTMAIGKNPEHLSISPDGKFLAINLEDKGKELAIVRIQPDGLLGERFYFPVLENASVSVNTAVTWHPSGKFLAFTTSADGTAGSVVAFYEVSSNRANAVIVQPYGNPIKVGNHLSMGKFTPDGKFFLVPDLKWRVYGRTLLSFLINPEGELIALRLDESSRHVQIASRAQVGVSPEGFAISPDGSLAVTVNMRRTYLPNWLPAWRGKDRNSLSLVKIDRESGQITTVGEYGFEGLLPEDAVFDADGKALAVAIYNDRIPSPKTGRIEFWNLKHDPNPRLERTGFKQEVVRGPHVMMLVK
jgi:DNA-binding beta-propeller fold protein YncE